MNERIKKLAKEAGAQGIVNRDFIDVEKFAELIVRECINQAHSVSDLRGVNDDMIYGADSAAARISKHFGVE